MGNPIVHIDVTLTRAPEPSGFEKTPLEMLAEILPGPMPKINYVEMPYPTAAETFRAWEFFSR